MTLSANKQNKPKSSGKQKKVIKLDNQVIGLSKSSVEKYDPQDLIFALDIGTRTVVGIVGIQEGDLLKIVGAEVAEHKNRAMLDGQIHDISQVAEIAKEVKEKLQKTLGVSLTKVAIAAAGRVLKTCEVKVERDTEQVREIGKDVISSIEMEAIQLAQLRLDEEVAKEEKTQYYCVGYSVINYNLNGFVISSLLGHKGKKIGVEILATFLPHIVVDSLYTVMNRIGLEVISLTLEPIAALNVTIPKDLRLLNLALVDIGAGTSDIAITKDGSVVAYAMAPIAGDEITEKIAQNYLVDFITGEKIKISLSNKNESVTFVDILGKKNVVAVNEVLEVINPSIELLADTISQKILEYNHKSPNAVFLIGGGSQIPGLTELIALKLKLPKDRVVVRGRDIIQNIKFKGKKLSGPEAITPFGIAVTAQMQKGQDFMSVIVNGKKIRLFNAKKLTVADALILVGFNPGQLIGRSGKSISFELNGVKKTIRGEYGNSAEILVNGKPANLETVLSIGDDINVKPAEEGKNAEACLSDYVNKTKKGKITLNGTNIEIDPKCFINSKIAASDSSIAEGDIVEINEIRTLKDLLKHSEIDVNEFEILVNGKFESEEYVLRGLDSVEYIKKEVEEKTLQTEQLIPNKKENGSWNNIKFVNKEIGVSTFIEEKKVIPIEEDNSMHTSVVVNGKSIFLKGQKSQYIFVDIFNYIDFDLSKPKGNIVLKLNSMAAAFTDIIKTGDVIEVYWDK